MSQLSMNKGLFRDVKDMNITVEWKSFVKVIENHSYKSVGSLMDSRMYIYVFIVNLFSSFHNKVPIKVELLQGKMKRSLLKETQK